MENFNLEDIAERSMSVDEFEKFKDNNKDYLIKKTSDGTYFGIHKSCLDTPLDYYSKGE